MSNLGKWERWYRGLDEPQPYGDSPTYRMGADWLEGLHVEDWGCGKGFLRRFVPAELYTGIDGSWSPLADVVTDLVDYRSETEGIFIRHVLEHDFEWRRILDNALASASRRIALVLFTPLAAETHQIAWNVDPGVPDISFNEDDIAERALAAGWDVSAATINSPTTQYGVETVFYMER